MSAVPTILDERFRTAAVSSGELDVAYDVLDDTPVGPLLVGVSDRGLCRVGFDPEPEAELERLARQFGPRVLRAPKAIDRVRSELDQYFAGRRHAFDLELDLRATPEFHCRVLEELNRVEYGHTTTYGTLAAQVGAPRAARAVGTVMNRNPLPIVLPCHRVVGANGSLTGYGGGLDRKESPLDERVRVGRVRIVGWEVVVFRQVRVSRPIGFGEVRAPCEAPRSGFRVVVEVEPAACEPFSAVVVRLGRHSMPPSPQSRPMRREAP
jgi:methylated-DNA-[protein]-cysteine S-methyltransferase